MKITSYRRHEADAFAFTTENKKKAEGYIARYPEGRQASAVIYLLYIAQAQNGGWLSPAAIEHVAEVLEMAPIRVYEVASFYTMFNQKPVGKHLIQVCRTTPCWLRGAADLTRICKDKLGVGLKEVTEDGMFSVMEVECLGACANAPMVQINDDYYEDLTPERLVQIIDDLRTGKEVPVGPQFGRLCSAPEGGPQTLTDVPPPGKRAPKAAKPADGTEKGA
jgi:NADH-quinone oxidoreductase E subunit